MRRPPERLLAGLTVAGAAMLAACTGGGGQLAQQDRSSTTAVPNAPIPTRALETPRSAAAVGRELRDVEIAIRGDDRDPARLSDLGRRQDLAYRALAAH